MDEKHKRGRRALTAGLDRGDKTPIHNLRVPNDEWATWQLAAKPEALSVWLRRLANRAARRVLKKRGSNE